jgi:hypothetical protein
MFEFISVRNLLTSINNFSTNSFSDSKFLSIFILNNQSSRLKLNLSPFQLKGFSSILREYKLIISSFLLSSILFHLFFNNSIFGFQSFINQSFSSCALSISSALAYSTEITAHSSRAIHNQIFHFLGDFSKKLLAIFNASYDLTDAHQIHLTASNGNLTKLLKVAIGRALIYCHLDTYCKNSFQKKNVSIHTNAIHQAKLSGFVIFNHSSV